MKALSNILFAGLAFVALASCDNYNQFEDEQYKKVLYVLSYDNNVFEETHFFNEEESTGHLTVYAGGTRPIDQDVTVEFEKDTALLPKFNLSNYELNVSKYAKELDPSKFELPSNQVTLKVGEEKAYSLFPIKINPAGLSPDSVYMIPLRIKSSSTYEVNPERSAVLYRLFIANMYANQKEATQYSMKGERKEEGKNVTNVTLNKRVFPISKNVVRTSVEIKAFANTLDFINRNSMFMEVNEDNSVTITAYNKKYLELVQLGTSDENRYGPDFMGVKRFYVYYKYRMLNSDGTWSNWTTMKENMRRVQ